MRGVWETKEACTFPCEPRARILRSFYSKANEAMQAHDAAGATRMPISRGIPVLIRKRFRSMWTRRVCVAIAPALIIGVSAPTGVSQQAQERPNRLELSRTARPWEFLPITGMRAGLLGNESGRMEAWVYPLKIFREFHLKFHTEGRVLPAEALARTVTVRPESSTILYAGDTFAVRETLFVPVHEQGAVILLDVETEQPFEIEAAFHRDFQLEWPAALGATYSNWTAEERAF